MKSTVLGQTDRANLLLDFAVSMDPAKYVKFNQGSHVGIIEWVQYKDDQGKTTSFSKYT